MKNKIILSIVFSAMFFVSGAANAREFWDVLGHGEDLLDQLETMDAISDTGFDVTKDKYTFGAMKELNKDTKFNFGLGAKLNKSQEYNLSNSYRGADSQTNMIEDRYKPLDASPMVGLSLDYKF